MKAFIKKLTAALVPAFAALTATTAALAEGGAYRSGSDIGYTFFCIGALAALIALWVKTVRRPKYKYL